MTEAEWLATSDVPTLLRWAVPRGTRRQLRLYLCGGCRAIQRHFWQTDSMAAVEAAERYADQQASAWDISEAIAMAEGASYHFLFDHDYWHGKDLKYRSENLERLRVHGALPPDYVWSDDWPTDAAVCDRLHRAADLAYYATEVYPDRDDWRRWVTRRVERWSTSLQVVGWPGRWLVDCVYGNPFRPPAMAREWRTPTVLAIADGVYADRAFDRLPVLADALEDAGCDAADLLAHCRGEGTHVRGCWVLDRLLDRPDEPPVVTSEPPS